MPASELSDAYTRKSPPGIGSPRAAAITATSTSPASCEPSTTATTGMRRLWSPPKKSATPHERVAASPRAMANTGGMVACQAHLTQRKCQVSFTRVMQNDVRHLRTDRGLSQADLGK